MPITPFRFHTNNDNNFTRLTNTTSFVKGKKLGEGQINFRPRRGLINKGFLRPELTGPASPAAIEKEGSDYIGPRVQTEESPMSSPSVCYERLEDMNGDILVEGVPVFVMLPLDTINSDGIFRYATSQWFNEALKVVKSSGIHGVAVDVWWGAVEKSPRKYEWTGYRQLFDLLRSLGLSVQVVLSFHACGGNVGDNAVIPLPSWVLDVGDRDPDIFFTDRPRDASRGRRNRECLSIFADEEVGLLKGRSPIQCYTEFMHAFREEFTSDLASVIQEIIVGCGPCGELRYPSYPESNGWRFPGIGEFQCYDRRALASLARAAYAVGHPDWGNAGPHDAGSYNSTPEECGFFSSYGGNWERPYGIFFLHWYANALLEHGDRMLSAATSVFNSRCQPNPEYGAHFFNSSSYYSDQSKQAYVPGMFDAGLLNGVMQSALTSEAAPPSQKTLSHPASHTSLRSYNSNASEALTGSDDIPAGPYSPKGAPVDVTIKIAGVHWWYRTRSHAAELTAGYLNYETSTGQKSNGYEAIVALCARHGVGLTLTCVEMCDSQHPPEALCGPEGLLRQVRESCAAAGVSIGGENALPCFMPNMMDDMALQRVVYNTQPWGTPLEEMDGGEVHLKNSTSHHQLPSMREFTFLRLTPHMASMEYQEKWMRFVRLMQRNAQKFKTSIAWREKMGFS